MTVITYTQNQGHTGAHSGKHTHTHTHTHTPRLTSCTPTNTHIHTHTHTQRCRDILVVYMRTHAMHTFEHMHAHTSLHTPHIHTQRIAAVCGGTQTDTHIRRHKRTYTQAQTHTHTHTHTHALLAPGSLRAAGPGSHLTCLPLVGSSSSDSGPPSSRSGSANGSCTRSTSPRRAKGQFPVSTASGL